jgi:hypothetical protein
LVFNISIFKIQFIFHCFCPNCLDPVPEPLSCGCSLWACHNVEIISNALRFLTWFGIAHRANFSCATAYAFNTMTPVSQSCLIHPRIQVPGTKWPMLATPFNTHLWVPSWSTYMVALRVVLNAARVQHLNSLKITIYWPITQHLDSFQWDSVAQT